MNYIIEISIKLIPRFLIKVEGNVRELTKETHIAIILEILIVFTIFLPGIFHMVKAIDNISTEDYYNVTLEDHGWQSSADYYLTNGDQIGVEITVTNADDASSDLTIMLETPDYTGGQLFYLKLGTVDFNEGYFTSFWTVLVNMGDSEGIHAIHITNQGTFAGGDSITFDVHFWSFSNTPASGDFSIPSENERVEGDVNIMWDFTDVDTQDVLWFELYYTQGFTTSSSGGYTYIGGTYDSYMVWDTTELTDGIYTLKLNVLEFDNVLESYEYFTWNYYFLHVEVDNINDPPSVSISSPNTDEIQTSSLVIRYQGTDPNNDDLTYSLYYSDDDISFNNIIVVDITETQYSWNISSIPDGDNYRVKVVVKDEHGQTQSDVSSKFTIDNPEYMELLSPTETVDTSIQTIKIETDALSAELILNGESKGSQTTGFEWIVQLEEGENLLEFILLDSFGTETRKTYTVSFHEPRTSSFPLFPLLLIALVGFCILKTRRRTNIN